MRKIIILVPVLLLLVSAVSADSLFGIGIQAGLDYPVVQDDQKQGTIFGFKGFWSFAGVLAIEPNITFAKFGDPESSDYPGLYDGLEGSKVTSYGVNALLGANFGNRGIHPYGMVGVAIYNMKRDQTFQDISELGMTGGLGLEIGVSPNIGIDGRGTINVIPLEEGGSKKSLSALVGVNYYFTK